MDVAFEGREIREVKLSGPFVAIYLQDGRKIVTDLDGAYRIAVGCREALIEARKIQERSQT